MIGMGLTCPTGQQPTSMYNGSTQCCGVPGTPCAADPCCILNNPNFLAAQATDVGPLGPNGVPLSAGNGPGAAELAEIASYPNNVQTDAINCWNNPGLLFVDSFGKTISCPAASLNDNGIFVSAYTPGQLAAMLAPTATPSTETAGNLPFATPGPTPGGSVPAAAVIPPVTSSPGGSVSSPSANGGTPAPANTSSTSGSSSSSTSSSTGSTDFSFLTDDSLISGVPNWGVALGALAALMILPSLIRGDR